MGKIKIPGALELQYQELPYYWIQVNPDRIQYTIPNHSHQELKKKLASGVTSTNANIRFYLDILLQLKAISQTGIHAVLWSSWLFYSKAAEQSTNLTNDPIMMTHLLDFQRQACVGRNYQILPKMAAKAAFWDTAPEVVLPRMTRLEHDNYVKSGV